jgi:large subunit ribosomal protein L15
MRSKSNLNFIIFNILNVCLRLLALKLIYFIKMFKNYFNKLLSSSFKTSSYFGLRNFKNFSYSAKSVPYSLEEFTTADEKSIVPHFRLNNIRDLDGAYKVKRRIGRGPGCTKGKTSGRGHKGYKARTGSVARHFEGGQTPLTRRLPKHGYRNRNTDEKINYLNINKLIYLIQKKRIDPTKPIGLREIWLSGGVSKIRDGLKLLARGGDELAKLPPLTIEVSFASKDAIECVKKYGGTVICKYRTPLLVRYVTKPHKFYKKLKEPYPPFRKINRLLNQEKKGAMYIFSNNLLVWTSRGHFGCRRSIMILIPIS